ncbi:universal stress protein [Chitinivorax sp. PXF-14]|uniref:universal stress protein n=1 Tax=Chitinivorax sp. PXF-14 TaxID=3230488 RepID=UPI00346556F3
MFKHILVPTDGSELSNSTVAAAVQLAATLGAKITALYVMEEYPVLPIAEFAPVNTLSVDEFRDAQLEQSKKFLKQAEQLAAAANVTFDAAAVASLSIYRSIIDTAEQKGCDLILMASHGRRGLEGLLLGSETHKVLTHSKIPVLVYR